MSAAKNHENNQASNRPSSNSPSPSQTSGSNIDERRAPRGLLVRPRQQFRYAFSMVAAGIVVQSIVVGGMAYLINVSASNVLATHAIDPTVGTAIASSINIACTIMMMVAVGFALLAVLMGIKLSHRIYGTMIPFQRHIEKLKNGDFSARIRLRRTDDLGELRDALNGLAEVLEKKYGSQTAK